jgi:hypothetical protein
MVLKRHIMLYFFFLWLYSPILGPGRLHETFRSISVTRSRTVGRTPWTSDRLVARPLLTATGECDDDGEVGGMNGFGKGNRSIWRKPAPTPLCPPQIPLADPGANPSRRGGKPAANRFSYGAATLCGIVNIIIIYFRIHKVTRRKRRSKDTISTTRDINK